MKCEFCGGTLSLEEVSCPHCGKPNKHAQQHVKDMEHYKGEFESTKRGVYSVARKYTQVTARVIIIAVLVVIMGIMLFVKEYSYSLRSSLLESDAKKNVEEYTQMMDEYLQKEDFKGFHLFVDEKGIEYLYGEERYDQYNPVIRTARSYTYFSYYMMSLVTDKEDYAIKSVCEYLNYFYRDCDMEQYRYYENADREENLKAIGAMEHNIHLMLQTYCHLTEEETAELINMSDAQRTVLIEEKIAND